METIRTRDVARVGSRVSWGAILAGAVTALSLYLLWGTLGIALGFSISGSVGDRELAVGATVWAVLATLLSLFVGGWVTSQCSVGESKLEAALYGVILWGVVFATLVILMGSGIQLGFQSLLSITISPAVGIVTERLTEQDLQQAGLTREQIERVQARAQNLPAELRARGKEPRSVAAAWWTFGGILLSMLTAVAGSLAGAGPNVVLVRCASRAPLVAGEAAATREYIPGVDPRI
jgi:hypothetical protein